MLRLCSSCLLFWSVALCGIGQHSGSGRATGLAGAQAFSFGNVWAIAFNPAGLSTLDHAEVSFAAAPQPFGLRELSSASVMAGAPLAGGAIGVGCNRFGYELFRQVTYSLAYARDIAGLSAGIGVNYTSLAISRYGECGAISIDAGVIVRCAPNVSAALRGENLTRTAVGPQGEPLRQSFGVGLLYLPVPSLALMCGYEREPLADPSLAGAVEYSILSMVTLRTGVSQTPPLIGAGFGIGADAFQLDYGYEIHPDLGGTHAITLTVAFGRSEGQR